LRTAVQRNQADVLIIGRREGTPIDTFPTEVFSWSPRAVLTIADTGKDGMVWIPRPNGTLINELSLNSLTAAAKMER
jgi:phosphosulfolactate phosphohydrolase-like enzyme